MVFHCVDVPAVVVVVLFAGTVVGLVEDDVLAVTATVEVVVGGRTTVLVVETPDEVVSGAGAVLVVAMRAAMSAPATGPEGASPTARSARVTAAYVSEAVPMVARTHSTITPRRFSTGPLSGLRHNALPKRSLTTPEADGCRRREPYRGRSMAAILIIEDDQRIRERLTRALAERGHSVDARRSGFEGLSTALEDRPDVVVLDLGLPDVDGAELLKMIRAVSTVPVVIATARTDETAVVALLDAGADDYVVKPFSVDQLEARIRAVLRRSEAKRHSGPLIVGGLQIDLEGRTASLDGTPLELTRKEFDLLAHLAERTGEVVSKRDLLAEVWREPYGGSDSTVDVHLSWLRKKLGESAAEPRYLRTVFGVGVKLVDPNS
jgi:DNA-binding response OmpR family regulator